MLESQGISGPDGRQSGSRQQGHSSTTISSCAVQARGPVSTPIHILAQFRPQSEVLTLSYCSVISRNRLLTSQGSQVQSLSCPPFISSSDGQKAEQRSSAFFESGPRPKIVSDGSPGLASVFPDGVVPAVARAADRPSCAVGRCDGIDEQCATKARYGASDGCTRCAGLVHRRIAMAAAYSMGRAVMT